MMKSTRFSSSFRIFELMCKSRINGRKSSTDFLKLRKTKIKSLCVHSAYQPKVFKNSLVMFSLNFLVKILHDILYSALAMLVLVNVLF